MKKLMLFLFILSSFNGYSSDSLWNVWADESKHDTIRLSSLKDYVWEKYLFTNPDTAFKLAQLQYDFAETKKQKKYMAIALNTQGVSFAVKGNRNKAQEYYEASLVIFKSINDKRGIANTLNNIGMIFSDVGDFKRAIEYYIKSLQIKKEINDKKGIPSTLNNIGVIYNNLKDYNNSLKYAQRSLEARSEDDYRGIASSLNNMASVYYFWADSIRNTGDEINAIKMASKSLLYHKKSAKLRKENNDIMGLASSYNNIGLVYKIGGNFKEAMLYIDSSIAIQQKLGDMVGLSESYEKKAGIYYEQGDYKNAITYADKSYQLAKDVDGLLQKTEATKVLYDCYKKIGDDSKALEMHEIYTSYNDSLLSSENQQVMINQAFKYEYEKAQLIKENEANEQARLLAEAKSRRNNMQYSIIFLGILLLFGIIISMGFIKVSPNIAEGLIFFAFLILFESILVFTEPYIEQYTQDEPMYNLLANSILAIGIFPIHSVLERLLKKRIVK